MSHRILVVEDDHELRNIVAETLEDDDYVVRSAMDVATAVKLSERERFDLILTDVRLPGPDNGVEGFKILKKRLPDLKCVVMTGYANLPPKRLAVEIGVSEYIYKPFTLSELLAVVDRVIQDKKWAIFYSNIVQKGPIRVLARAFSALKRDRVSEVNEARAKVFNALYLAINCDRDPGRDKDGGQMGELILPKDTANGLYYQLETLDTEYEQYLSQPTAEMAKKLLQIYGELLERFNAFIVRRAGLVEKGRLEVKEFNCIYESIQKGRIRPNDFLLAPALRVADKSSLRDAPELLELQRKMWEPA